ncbi:MAG: NAD+ synthase [Chlamydiota bacterium]
MRVYIAQLNPTIGDLVGNTDKILQAIDSAREKNADIVVTPELAITGYPPEDFLMMPHFIQEVERQLSRIIQATSGISIIVGLPRANGGDGKPISNSAAIISDGKILGYQDKALLPTYDVFSERRYFEPAKGYSAWEIAGKRVVVTICEDIWHHAELIKRGSYPHDPVEDVLELDPELLVNLSASPFNVAKVRERIFVCQTAAQTLSCPVVLCNQVGGNDSLIFDGHSLYIGENGNVLKVAHGFEEDGVLVDTDEELSAISLNISIIKNLYDGLVLGVRDYFRKSGFKKACVALSGGIDSAVVACIAGEALGPENLLGVTMPSRYSSKGSVKDAKELAENLGIEFWEISIENPFSSYLETLAPFFGDRPADVTEENLQARSRGMMMMAISNKFGKVVLATGNKSEMAVGYATLYGDMCGGLGVISDVTKQQVYDLAEWINREGVVVPLSTITKPPSAELRPDQKDSDSLPDYEILDNVLKSYVEDHLSPGEIVAKYGYSHDLVEDLIKMIHRNEYKRRQSAPGLRVSPKAFSVGRHFPIVQRWV